MKIKNEKGSLALEQVLFIGAVVLLAVGIGVFYQNLSDFFANFNFDNAVEAVPVVGNNNP